MIDGLKLTVSALFFKAGFDLGEAYKACHLGEWRFIPQPLALKILIAPVLTGFVLFFTAGWLHQRFLWQVAHPLCEKTADILPRHRD